MATPRQIEANRMNALRSTGPRTPEGKARSSLNAVTHGILAKDLLKPREDQALLEKFRSLLLDDLAPVGALEGLLAHKIINASWKLRRLDAVEAGMLDAAEISDNHPSVIHVASETCPKFARYSSSLERSFYRALHELQRLQAARAGREVPLPAQLDVDVHLHTEP